MTDEESKPPPTKKAKGGKDDENGASQRQKTLLDDVLPFAMDYLAFFELPTPAAVSRAWRKVASESYVARINRPWAKEQLVASGSVEIQYLEAESPKLKYLQARSQKMQGNGVNYEEIPYWRAVIYPPLEMAAILTALDVESDLPPPLQAVLAKFRPEDVVRGDKDDGFAKLTSLAHASLVRGVLLLVISHNWTPVYSDALKSYANEKSTETKSNLEDRYERYKDIWRSKSEEQNGADGVSKELEFDYEEDKPGADLWGFLYKLPRAAVEAAVQHYTTHKGGGSQKDPIPKLDLKLHGLKLLDVQRLATNDFPDNFCDRAGFDYHQSIRRSENGKVVCLETGVLIEGRPEDEPPCNHCTPTMNTMGITDQGLFETPIPMVEPLKWPTPGGLSDTYYSYFALSPAGDCLFAHYGDLGSIEAEVFYTLRSKPAGGGDSGATTSMVWEQLWDTEGEANLQGFFTADGDFCVTENGGGEPNVPGPMAVGQVIRSRPKVVVRGRVIHG